jgi:hypothetical protein
MIDPGRRIRDGTAFVAAPLCTDGFALNALASDAIAEVGRAGAVGAVVWTWTTAGV